jgi:hypothetical protein
VRAPIANKTPDRNAAAIRVELIGADRRSAGDLTAVGHAPVLALCRMLIEAGQDPASPLYAYRGNILCLWVRSIGETTALEINAKGTAFVARRAVRTGSPVRGKRDRVAPPRGGS